MQHKSYYKLVLLLFAIICSFPCFSQVKEFRSWEDVSRLVGNGAEFYGESRGTKGAISLIPDGEKYWLYIRGAKFRPVHTVSLKPNVAVLGINDQGKPIAFSLHLSSSEKPYITFDTRRTENIFLPGDYGWEYYEPDILNGKPLIRMYTYDHYNGESSRPEPARYYIVNDKAPVNKTASNNPNQKQNFTYKDFQGKVFSGGGNIAHIGYDLSIAFGYDGFCVCSSESGSEVGWEEKSVEGSYQIDGNKIYVKCSEGNWEFEIQQGGKKLFFDKSEGQGMPNYMTLEYSHSGVSAVSEKAQTPYIRKNKFGKKLVKSISEEWIDWKGERPYNLCHTYNFEYDADGNLKSVSKTSEDKPHKFVEKLEFVDNNFQFSVMQDGKPIKTHKREYIWDRATNKRPTGIKGCLITDLEKDDDGFNHYFATIHYYTDTYALKMDCIGFDTFNEWIENIKEDQFNGLWSARDMNPLNHLYLIPSSIFNGFGFKNGMHHYMSADSIMYMVDKYEMKEFAYMNGNPVDRPRGELSDYSNPSKYGMEYSSQDNNTNINILMLTYTVSKNSFYQNIESITEWFPIQSKKLPSYKGRRGDRFDRKWDYKFDDEGNLVEIIVDDYTYGGKSTVAYTISYVSE